MMGGCRHDRLEPGPDGMRCPDCGEILYQPSAAIPTFSRMPTSEELHGMGEGQMFLVREQVPQERSLEDNLRLLERLNPEAAAEAVALDLPAVTVQVLLNEQLYRLEFNENLSRTGSWFRRGRPAG